MYVVFYIQVSGASAGSLAAVSMLVEDIDIGKRMELFSDERLREVGTNQCCRTGGQRHPQSLHRSPGRSTGTILSVI